MPQNITIVNWSRNFFELEKIFLYNEMTDFGRHLLSPHFSPLSPSSPLPSPFLNDPWHQFIIVKSWEKETRLGGEVSQAKTPIEH